MPHLRDIPLRLAELSERGLLREPDDDLAKARLRTRFGPQFLDLTTNDYLGLASEQVPRETLHGPPGAGASRLIHGSTPEHLRVEAQLAQWTGTEAALLFTSGYAANVGTLACLLGPDDAVFSDALNHASLIDGCRLSRAQVHVVPHLDLAALESQLEQSRDANSRWVVVESYYSMDGTSPDMPALRALCDRYDAHLYVDEAHALGIFGPEGAGRCAQQGVQPDVLVGGLGKACGAQGGFVAGRADLRTWLWNRARSFVFSTALSPALAELIGAQLQRLRGADEQRRRLHDVAAEFRRDLEERGLPLIAQSHGPIVGVVVGEPELATSLGAQLREEGILVQAIRPPTVPTGTSRLRLTVTARHQLPPLRRAASLLAHRWGSAQR